MACQGCGSSTKNRYAPKVSIVGDVDSKKTEAAPMPYPRPEQKSRPMFHPPPHIDPEEFRKAEEATRAMSFEELQQAVTQQKKNISGIIESDLAAMTPAIRRLHIISLVEVANYEINPLLAITPDQAVINLKAALDREDFKEINELYPNLKDQVSRRYAELVAKRIVM